MQPAAADGLGGRSRIVPVTLHDVRAASQHLAVRGDGQLDTGQWRADGAELVAILAIERDDRRAFRQPVTLHDQDACGMVRFGHRQGQRGAAGAEPVEPRAEHVAEFAGGF